MYTYLVKCVWQGKWCAVVALLCRVLLLPGENTGQATREVRCWSLLPLYLCGLPLCSECNYYEGTWTEEVDCSIAGGTEGEIGMT